MFNLAGWLEWYGRNLIVCLTVASTIHLLFDAARWWLARPGRPEAQRTVAHWRAWQRSLLFAGIPLAGVALGWPLGVVLAGSEVLVWTSQRNGANIVLGTVLLSLLISFLMHHWFAAKSRQLDAERRATEAQLRLLQGQIEPHFLFNTLAGLMSLIEADPPKARQVLQAFTDYLRSALGALRQDAAPLGQELTLVAQYLALMQARMEDRLRFDIDADDAVRQLLVPPLLLQPLIENAIVHGLEPSIHGGTVQVRARLLAGQLQLQVQDDGRGLNAAPRAGGHRGHGLALANLRERLASRYGGAASFTLQAAQPGTLATLLLPMWPDGAGGASAAPAATPSRIPPPPPTAQTSAPSPSTP
jgi:hypothetical protein